MAGEMDCAGVDMGVPKPDDTLAQCNRCVGAGVDLMEALPKGTGHPLNHSGAVRFC